MESSHALNRRSGAAAVEGFLICANGGYGCVQPWPMFGHPSLEDHWNALAAGVSLPLLDQAMQCAHLDAEARSARTSWWDDGKVPLSHATVTHFDEELTISERGFTHAKLKAAVADTPAILRWAERHPEIRLRLDFNELPNRAEFESWLTQIPAEIKTRIDWIEDPFVFDASAWHACQTRENVELAIDRAFSGERIVWPDVSIWKPAWQPLPTGIRTGNVIVTSAMDHPVGQAWAAYSAAQAGIENVCGLRTDHLFEADAFLEMMGPWSPAWPNIRGTGMGFDELLENLSWTRIR